MKTILIYFGAIITLICLVMCEKSTDKSPDEKTMKFVKVNPGGCNLNDYRSLKNALQEQQDTVIFSIRNDTLDTYIGINYICCAPFMSSVEMQEDNIIYTIEDTCNSSEESCYCRCMCYYTWDFLLLDFEEGEYDFKVVLKDPRQEHPIIIKEGIVDFSLY